MREPWHPRAKPWWLCDLCCFPIFSYVQWALVTKSWTMRGHKRCMTLYSLCEPSFVTRMDYRLKGAPETDDSVLH